MKKYRLIKRSLAFLLAFAMMTGSLSLDTFTAYAEEEQTMITEGLEESDVVEEELTESEEEQILPEQQEDSIVEESEVVPSEAIAPSETPVDLSEEASLQNDGEDSSDYTVETHSIEWLRGSPNPTLEGDTLRLTTQNRDIASNYAVLRVNFSFGGEGDPIPAGKINIRIPAYIFTDRSGNGIGQFTTSLSTENEGITGFKYYIDNKGTEGTADDEVVIVNYRDIATSYFFTADFQYNVAPIRVADEYENTEIKASYDVETADGTKVEAESNYLTVQMDTTIPGAGGQKTATRYETWQSIWGEEPEDADDYFYLSWYITSGIEFVSTQPYIGTFKEKDYAPGEVVGWRAAPVGSSTYEWHDGLEDFEESYFERDESDRPSGVYQRYVIVRYKRSEIAPGTVLRNTVTRTNTGYEGETNSRDVTGTYTYYPISINFVSPGLTAFTKGTGSVFYGGINVLENDRTITERWGLSISSNGYYSYEIDEEGNYIFNGEEYETRIEDSEMVYEYVSDSQKRLTADDYEITTFFINSFTENIAVFDENTGVKSVARSNYDEYGTISVYVRTKENPEFHKIGEVTKNSEGGHVYTATDGTTQTVTSDAQVNLPEGTYGIRFSHVGDQYSVSYSPVIYTKYLPSENTKEYLANRNSGSIYNVGVGALYKDGEQKAYRTRTDPHSYFNRVTGGSSVGKVQRSIVSNNAEGQEETTYRLYQYDSAQITTGFTEQEIIDMGLITEHKEGVFYDLLPAGSTVDTSSIRAYKAIYYRWLPGYTTGSRCPTEVEFVENWKDTGRTMMIIRVTASGDSNYEFDSLNNGTSTVIRSGFIVDFKMITPWNDLLDYSTHLGSGRYELLNSMAYQSLDGPLANGNNDDGGTLMDKALMSDLDGSGATGDADGTFKYAELKTTYSPLLAAELGFTKRVKGSNDVRYSQETTSSADGTYSYQLRFANGKQKSKDIVMYEILETADPNATSRWQGTFESLNISQIRAKGIDAKVYYSTSTAFSGMLAGKTFTDLSDTSLWSQTAPSDPSKVTAIAIDLTKNTDGEDFVFEPEEVALAYITMKAPHDVTPFADDPETEEDETVYAYNSAYLGKRSVNEDGSDGPTVVEETTVTKVSLEQPNVTIAKNARIGTNSWNSNGSAASPSSVPIGSTLTYTLTTTNNESSNAVRDVIVTDTIPVGLTVDTENIMVYHGTAGGQVKVSESSEVTMEVVNNEDGSTELTFVIDKIAVTDAINFRIPTTVLDTASVTGYVMENTAYITKVNDLPQEKPSNTTYHKATTSATVTKVWEDDENADGRRPTRIYAYLRQNGSPLSGFTSSYSLYAGNNWTYTVNGLPKYDADGNEHAYTFIETSVPNGYTVDYSEDGKTITNTFHTVDVGAAAIQIQKYRTGSTTPVEGAVFTLTDSDDNTVGTATTNAAGVASFTITPSDYSASTLTYTLLETSAPDGFAVSEDTWTVTLTRSETATWRLINNGRAYQRTWTYTTSVVQNEEEEAAFADGTLTVYNDYEATGKLSLTGTKHLTGRTIKNGEFTFHVYEGDKLVSTGTAASDETITFEDIEYSFSNGDVRTHTYTVYEVNSGKGGMDYDSTVYTVTATVEDDGKGKLTATPTYPADGLVFNNTYTTNKVSVSLAATKELIGDKELEADMFTFTLSENDKVLQTKTNDANKTVSFEQITYTLDDVGEHVYTIRETKGTINGMSYDETPRTVTVTVADDTEGALSAAVSYAGGSATFTNTYDPEDATITIPVKKVIEGNDRPDGEVQTFTFALSANGAAPMPEEATVSITGEGTASFDTITFTKAGTYSYTLRETGDEPTGYYYDRTARTVTVTVTDEDGVLRATSAQFDKDNPVTFTNTYDPEDATIAIPVRKAIDGKETPEDKTFTFLLTGLEGAPMPEEAETAELSIEGENIAVFDTINFDTAGSYRYTLEEIAGEEDGYTYDDTVYSIVVTVVDQGGKLNATWTLDGAEAEEAVFTNEYQPFTAEWTPKATKVLENNTLADGQFTFVLRDADGNELQSVTNAAGGSITFDKVEYDAAGTYVYQMAEQKGTDTTITYDETVFTITVTVIDENGTLTAEADLGETDLTFTNVYNDPMKPTTTSTSETPKSSKTTSSGTKTGDDTLAGLWLAILAIAAAFLGYSRRRRRG